MAKINWYERFENEIREGEYYTEDDWEKLYNQIEAKAYETYANGDAKISDDEFATLTCEWDYYSRRNC